jgi:hypothetical protein
MLFQLIRQLMKKAFIHSIALQRGHEGMDRLVIRLCLSSQNIGDWQFARQQLLFFPPLYLLPVRTFLQVFIKVAIALYDIKNDLCHVFDVSG